MNDFIRLSISTGVKRPKSNQMEYLVINGRPETAHISWKNPENITTFLNIVKPRGKVREFDKFVSLHNFFSEPKRKTIFGFVTQNKGSRINQREVQIYNISLQKRKECVRLIKSYKTFVSYNCHLFLLFLLYSLQKLVTCMPNSTKTRKDLNV